jgi:hypothetical protein
VQDDCKTGRTDEEVNNAWNIHNPPPKKGVEVYRACLDSGMRLHGMITVMSAVGRRGRTRTHPSWAALWPRRPAL